MPYIITTTMPPEWEGETLATTTRRAVATLDEAREAVLNEVENDPGVVAHMESSTMANGYRTEAQTLPADGGTIGPLPDGTMIEVAPVEWADLPPITEARKRYPTGNPRDAVIRAYNAQVTA